MSDTLMQIRDARRISEMSLEQAASSAGVSKSTYQIHEQHPENFRLCEIRGLFDSMTKKGQDNLRRAVMENFLS